MKTNLIKTMFGKGFAVKSILLATLALLVMSCSSDDEFEPENHEYFEGQWYETFADENIISDGSLTFVFAHGGICHVENYNALGDPEHPELSVIKEHGSWSYDSKTKFLTIETEYVIPITNEPAQHKRVYKLSKFSQDSFHAYNPFSSQPQEQIFLNEKRVILYFNHKKCKENWIHY